MEEVRSADTGGRSFFMTGVKPIAMKFERDGGVASNCFSVSLSTLGVHLEVK